MCPTQCQSLQLTITEVVGDLKPLFSTGALLWREKKLHYYCSPLALAITATVSPFVRFNWACRRKVCYYLLNCVGVIYNINVLFSVSGKCLLTLWQAVLRFWGYLLYNLKTYIYMCVCVCVCVYICIYVHCALDVHFFPPLCSIGVGKYSIFYNILLIYIIHKSLTYPDIFGNFWKFTRIKNEMILVWMMFDRRLVRFNGFIYLCLDKKM